MRSDKQQVKILSGDLFIHPQGPVLIQVFEVYSNPFMEDTIQVKTVRIEGTAVTAPRSSFTSFAQLMADGYIQIKGPLHDV